ncbi:MAG TPA: ATP-binding protein [Kofleriaceae bacterium]|nr:ATP-binding protein [Kofleriaceae bacterium]
MNASVRLGSVVRGEMAEQISSFDWSTTSLGPIEAWPQSLKTALSLILNAQMPMWLGWGPEMIFFYNDAYVQVLSHAKHPWALGRPASVVWKEIWDVCGPLAARVFERGEAPFVEDVRLFMDRGGGFLEEVFYSFSYSPIADESGQVGGLFCPNTEVTAKLLHSRRLRTLSELAARALIERTRASACASVIATLARNPDDVPFALLYLADPGADVLRLEHSIGVAAGDVQHSPTTIPLTGPPASIAWPIRDAFLSGRTVTTEIAPNDVLPIGLAQQPVREAIALPILASGENRAMGVLLAGVNPARRLDADHAAFFELMTGQVATALQRASAAEEEKRRADMLAELDRAKTLFFSNVSHEFRTPLTLMIGPTEDALASPSRTLSGESLETVYRNELRLLKLVNALLDFSRLEAGRMVARMESVDLARLTEDLASSFRSAIERAGLRFEVDTTGVETTVMIDPDLWEKIVLNLLSNALKFTLEGTIRLTLAEVGGNVELVVADTGTGIPAEALPHLFERFRRIHNARARTQEGSGIGLALVQELTRLHGGVVSVESEVARGTTFRISIPAGEPSQDGVANRAAAAPDRRSGLTRASIIEEAARWEPGAQARDASASTTETETILVADDNADMRDYLRRLLAPHWHVIAVADGDAALAKATAHAPDLVISDVMMPGLDGFALVAALRADPRTRSTPIVLLSARAGDEASVEGLSAGADDYLVKPFSARELIARVRTHLALARARRTAEKGQAELYGLLMQVPAAISVRTGPDARCIFQNAMGKSLVACEDRPLREMVPELPEAWFDGYRRALAGETHVEHELAITRDRPGEGPTTRYYDVTWAPVRYGSDDLERVLTITFDVTTRKEAQLAREMAEQRLRAALSASNIGTYSWDVRSNTVEHDAGVKRLFGFAPDTGDTIDEYTERVHEDDRPRWLAGLEATARDGADFLQEYRVVIPGDETRWILDKGQVMKDGAGRPVVMVGAAVDITDQKRLSEAALAASRAKDEFLAMLGHELRNPLAPIVTAVELMKLRGVPAGKELGTIERQLRHITGLVDDLLDVSRVSRGAVKLKLERVTLRDVVSRALETVSPLLDEKRHSVTVDVAGALWIHADAMRLTQVFSNLFTNAARYSEAGGRIHVTARSDGDHAVVEVADTGMGIAPDLLPHIFDLFVQGSPRTGGHSFGGLGIGLALVQNLVRLHGGDVIARSEGPGHGSTFTVRLPMAGRAVPVRDLVAHALGEDPETGTGMRILVVDDNADAADLLSELLQSFGHVVQTANSPERALVIADAFQPQIAVLDIGLPVMDGYELAQHLRERGLEHCRLIALTGYGQDHDHARSMDAGFHAHLTKPVSSIELLRALRPDSGLGARD